MNPKSPLRRAAVLTAGALIGLSGAFALAGPASAHHNLVSGTADCDVVTGEWVVSWKVQAIGNTPTYQWTKVEWTPEDTKFSNADLAVNGKALENAKELTTTQRVSTKFDKASLTVGAKWTNNHEAEKTGWVDLGGKCEKTPGEEPPPPVDEEPPATPDEPTTPEEPTTPPEVPSDLPGEPEPIFEANCDTMTIGLDNPVDGVKFTLKFKTSKGEERTLVIKPGEKKSETFSAKPGFSIKLTFTATVQGQNFSETTTIEYEQPNDCDSSGGGGGLAETGAAAGSIAGGAGALLAVGAGVFFMARRRKVKFTA